jgi:hypothetical protein
MFPKSFLEGHQDSLALFAQPPVDTSIDRLMITEYKYDGNLAPGSTIEFTVPGTSPHYIDISRTKIKLTIRITKEDGTLLSASDVVGCSNLMLHSLIQQVDLSLNQINTSASIGRKYPYKSSQWLSRQLITCVISICN